MGGHCSAACSQKINEKNQEDVEDGIDSVASTQVAVHEILEFLNKVQLFKRLPEDLLPSLAPVCEVKDYLPGEWPRGCAAQGRGLFWRECAFKG
eukprot:Skav235103  [mRNA]  locus=scaffold711:167935:169434:- [translate_table: standard]